MLPYTPLRRIFQIYKSIRNTQHQQTQYSRLSLDYLVILKQMKLYRYLHMYTIEIYIIIDRMCNNNN